MSENLYRAPDSDLTTPTAGDSLKQVQPTTGFVIYFLWATFWRSMLISIPIMIAVGIATAAIFEAIGRGDLANPMASFFTFIVSLIVWVMVTKSVIGKQIGAYRLVVVAGA